VPSDHSKTTGVLSLYNPIHASVTFSVKESMISDFNGEEIMPAVPVTSTPPLKIIHGIFIRITFFQEKRRRKLYKLLETLLMRECSPALED